jgi:hypothetical protein
MGWARKEAHLPAQTCLSKSSTQRQVSYQLAVLCKAGVVDISNEHCLHSLWKGKLDLSQAGQEDMGWS